MKRKVLSVILTGAMVAGLAGTVTVHAEEQKTYNIGICQLVQHEALDAATQGFEDAVKEGLGEENVTFDEQNAQGDSATCSTIINNFVSSNVDLILANATASLQAAAAGTSDIPILGTAVTEYGVALDLTDFDGTVGGNISGTSDLAPLDQQAAMLNELFPDAKTVGLLYCSAEPNSQYQVDTVKAALEDLGYTCEYYAFSDSNDISSVVTNAVADSDVIYVPTDNTAASNTELINNICLPAKVPAVLYNVPSRTGCSMSADTIAHLVKNVEYIVGVKEASGNISHVAETIEKCDGKIDIYSGNDDQIVPILSLGGKGVISVLSNIAPRETHDIVELFMNGKIEESRRLQLKALPLVRALFSEVNPIPVKAAMNLMGMEVGPLRMPLTEMEEAHKKVLADEMVKFGLRLA